MEINVQSNKPFFKHVFLFLIILLIFQKGFSQGFLKNSQLIHFQATGDNYYKEYNFGNALDYYLKYYGKDSTNSEVNYKIGMCYLNVSEYEFSRKYLDKALKDTAYFKPSIFYYEAKAYQLEHKFDQSITYYKKYLNALDKINSNQDQEEIKNEIIKCYTAKKMFKESKSKPPVNLGNIINSKYPDYGAVLNADETALIFTSERPNTTGGKKNKIDGSFHDDIYMSKKIDGKWGIPTGVDELNTNHDDAVVALSHDGQKLIIYRYGHSNLLSSSGDLYLSHLIDEKWSKPEKMGHHINSKYRESSACFSNNDKELYFVSDRPGGFGGLDIYKITKNKKDEWSEPVNLGASINTPYDEESPYIHPDGTTFYFSSEGHENMGGYDIFKASLDENNNWIRPTNLGYPINTSNDDVYFNISANGRHIFFSDHRKENSYGHEDIYYAEANIEKSKVLLLTGLINDNEGNPLSAKVEIIDKNTNGIITLTTSNKKTGGFLIVVKEGVNYKVSITKSDYNNISFDLNTEGLIEYQEKTKNIILTKR